MSCQKIGLTTHLSLIELIMIKKHEYYIVLNSNIQYIIRSIIYLEDQRRSIGNPNWQPERWSIIRSIGTVRAYIEDLLLSTNAFYDL